MNTEDLKRIINRYEKYKNDPKFIGNERQICMSLIFPLFHHVLGWDTEDPSEFQYEYSQSGKIMDCLVFLNGISQFVIEAKSLTKDIVDNYKFYEQAVKYAISKEKPFAILTNFKEFIILRCDVEVDNILKTRIGVVSVEDIKNRNLGLLSNFEKKYWIEKGKDNEIYSMLNLKRRQPVGEQLLEDLKKWRISILRNLKKHEKKNNFDFENEIDCIEEEVQRFIDRLIFICFCEDKELNERELKSLLIEKKDRFWDKPGFLLNKIRKIFEDYREGYNSDLFNDGLCDNFYLEDSVIFEILIDLRQPFRRLPYDFKSIDIDILGKTYENFIGHLLSGKKRFIEKESIGKRKEEGIYYTPQFVVNYIVENTVSKYIKNKQFHKIKILDPACGSGSFLIKAYDVMLWSLRKRLKHELEYPEKCSILLNNIFGVDKDERACDIAKLNLSLKLAERNQPIPELHNNIRNGDSLVDDKNIDRKAFEWNRKFKNTMNAGGFDVIIGNPPYVFTRDVEFLDSFKKYIQKNYFKGLETTSKSHARQAGKINLYSLFILRSIKLLAEKGLMGFIVPNNLLRTTTYDIVRKFILDNCKILQIVDLGSGVFKGVTASTIIIILQKERNENERNKNKILVISDIVDFINQKYKTKTIGQKEFLNNTSYTFNITIGGSERDLFEKMEKGTIDLGDIAVIHAGGIATGPNKKEMIENHQKNSKYKPMLEGKDIKPFYPNFSNRYILYDRKLLYRARDESIFLSPEKVITQRIGGGNKVLIASYDNRQFYTFNSTNTILPKDENYSLKYILALLNSKLFNWYYVNKFTNKSTLTVNISKTFLEKLPVKKISKGEQGQIIQLVDKIILLYERLDKIGDKITDEKRRIENEVKELESKINEEIYKLYGITDSEKKVIEA